MSIEWPRFCKFKKYRVEGISVLVYFGDERKHKVEIHEEPDGYRFSAIVVSRSIAERIANLPIRAWMRNRETQLVGFQVDNRGRLIAESRVPTLGLTEEEFRIYLDTTASEADRFEFALTGKDLE